MLRPLPEARSRQHFDEHLGQNPHDGAARSCAESLIHEAPLKQGRFVYGFFVGRRGLKHEAVASPEQNADRIKAAEIHVRQDVDIESVRSNDYNIEPGDNDPLFILVALPSSSCLKIMYHIWSIPCVKCKKFYCPQNLCV